MLWGLLRSSSYNSKTKVYKCYMISRLLPTLTWYQTLNLGSFWESDTNVWKVTDWRSQITVFTSVGDLDKMRNEYGYNNFILVLNCTHETSWKALMSQNERRMNEEWWMKNDEGWMKNDEWNKNGEGWWFHGVEGFWWWTTFVNIELLLKLKMFSSIAMVLQLHCLHCLLCFNG